MTQEPITIVSYDPEWPRKYAEEETRIQGAIGEYVLSVEHIGSTAVAGLSAKPIIDIMVGVRTLAEAEACIDPLTRLGYEYCPEFEDAMPQRRYFRKVSSGAHTHHVHMETDSRFWDRHLRFRDYLRDHPDTARQYEVLKRELAETHRHDVASYGVAKSQFIEEIENRAREEYEDQ